MSCPYCGHHLRCEEPLETAAELVDMFSRTRRTEEEEEETT